MRVSQSQVSLIAELTEVVMKFLLFLFILTGVAVLTAFFIYCVMTGEDGQAKTISGYGDAIFVTAFGKLVWNYFVRKAALPATTTMPTAITASSEADNS